MPTSETTTFALDRERFSQGLIERFGWAISLLDMCFTIHTVHMPPARDLSTAIATYFSFALEAQAIRAPSNLQVAVLAVDDDKLAVTLREHGIAADGGRLTRHASTHPLGARNWLQYASEPHMSDPSSMPFDVCCDLIDSLLECAPALIGCLEAMRADDEAQRDPAEHPLFAALRNGTPYGEEIAIVVAGGRTIRTNAGRLDAPWIGADYLRVCDPDGTEVGYWTHAEWGEDPVGVVSAVFACALRVQELAARA